MIQRAYRLCFLLKTKQPFSLLGKCSGQNLNRHIPVALLITRAIHLTHAALAQLCTDFVTVKFCAWLKRHCFIAACQFRIIVGAGAVGSPISVPIRNFPSAVTSKGSARPYPNIVRVANSALGSSFSSVWPFVLTPTDIILPSR